MRYGMRRLNAAMIPVELGSFADCFGVAMPVTDNSDVRGAPAFHRFALSLRHNVVLLIPSALQTASRSPLNAASVARI